MTITAVLRNGTSRVGFGYVIQCQGLVGTIGPGHWCQVYVVPPGGGTGGAFILHGNVLCHGLSNPYVVLGARELASVSTQPWVFQLHSAPEDTLAADGAACSLIAEHYDAGGLVVETVTVTTLTFDRWGDLATLQAAVAHFSEADGALGDILRAVRHVY